MPSSEFVFLISVAFYVFLPLTLAETEFGCSLGDACVPLRECSWVMQELQQGRKARSEGNSGLVISIVNAIKGVLCGVDAKTVCCPKYMGSIILENGLSQSRVYAVNSTHLRILDLPRNNNLDAFFWREENCFPLKEFKKLPEDFDSVKSVDNHYVDIALPNSIKLDTVRCISVWEDDILLGYGHLSMY